MRSDLKTGFIFLGWCDKIKRMRKSFFIFFLLFNFYLVANPTQAAVLGEEVVFNVDATYDAVGRNQSAATLRVIGERIYFYVDNNYWGKILPAQRTVLQNALVDLTREFDRVIYSKERSVFGSEWNPGIDNDERITALVLELKKAAGGYWNSLDEYPQNLAPKSNQREMVYLNALYATSQQAKSFLAHEFQHLITFYQKNKLYHLEEDVWLNEGRSEYAPTLCGYDDVYSGSNLAQRVDIFLDEPSDSLTEWKNKTADYGPVALFLQYLVDHYGLEILTRMTLNNQVGMASINQALSELEYSETFSDVFTDWALANYLNSCQDSQPYCYLNKNLTYQRLHVEPTASYSGFPYLIVSRSSSVTDWTPVWYRFRPQSGVETTKDTLKLEFESLQPTAQFRVPYITTDQSGQSKVSFIPLDNQAGAVYIPDFGNLIQSVVMIPFNQYKMSNFTDSELATAFSFTASSIELGELVSPIINSLSPGQGSISGGFEIIIKGEQLSSVSQIVFGQQEISQFKIIDEQTITFTAPPHSAGSVDIILTNSDGQQAFLANAFTYLTLLPEGTLIRAKGDYKVYIIKGNYRRWIQSAAIFNFYGHLNWQAVIEVTPQERDAYQEAWLIRADGSAPVYEVNADGTKHWLNMTAGQFSQSGRQWDMVYIINSFERDFYRTGADVLFK